MENLNGVYGCATLILAVLGAIMLIGTIIVIATIIVQEIKEKIQEMKYQYKRKHRFDGPPIAKCYCKDCIYWREEGLCSRDKGRIPATLVVGGMPVDGKEVNGVKDPSHRKIETI